MRKYEEKEKPPNEDIFTNDVQKLTYKVISKYNLDLYWILIYFIYIKTVMDRMVKRYIMYNQGDIDDLKQSECEEIKKEMQLMRFEIKNDMRKSRDDTVRNMLIVNNGITFIAEELLEQSAMMRRASSVVAGSIASNGDKPSADDTLSLSSQKTGKFRDIVLKNRSILKSITFLSNVELKPRLSLGDKDGGGGGAADMDSSNNTSTSDYHGEGPSSSTLSTVSTSARVGESAAARNEEFNLERLAFDIDTVYLDDL